QVYIEPAVVCEQLWMSAMEQAGLVPESQLAIERFTMLEYTNDPEWPEARIKQGFLKKEIKAKEENMVRACEWFLQIHGDPRGCLDALTNVCKAFLLTGRAGAAIELVRRLPFKTISLKETFDATGRAFNIMDADADEVSIEEPPAHNLRRSTRSGSQLPSSQQQSRPSATTASQQHHDRFVAAFKLQSRLYHEMTQLADTLDAINEWQVVEYAIRETGSTEFMPRNFKQQVLDKFSAVKYHVGQLLSSDFLTHVQNEKDAKQFEAIRAAYLPEIMVAYNSIIYVAGSFTDRERLLQSLELANTIAKEQNKGVQDLFVKTGRM
ncbi:hypothetical protein LTS18_001451, partial [Coniosporium uncinatum]